MRKCVLVACVAIIALVVAAPAAATSHARVADAHIAKKCKKTHGKKCKKSTRAPVVTPPAPAPLALTDAEVINRVVQKADQYCQVDVDCIDSGYYATDPGLQHPECSSQTAYSWSCYGWNDEDGDFVPAFATCDFREVVERVGYNGITSHQDLSFGGSGGPGWDCYAT